MIEAALRIAGDRGDVRIVRFSVQGNHIHLVVEAPDRGALARAIQGFSIRIARGLNRMMGRAGRVFADRYHARLLRTPTEVRHVLHYVAGSARKHAAERGATYSDGYVDPYSSVGVPELVLPSAQTWLLREGWRRAGPCADGAGRAADDRRRSRGCGPALPTTTAPGRAPRCSPSEARAARPDHLGPGRPRRRGTRRSRGAAIAAVVDALDRRSRYADVRARGETAGASATDPTILLGLWIDATRDGVGSGRETARLVELHAAYRWLCGGRRAVPRTRPRACPPPTPTPA